MTKDREDPITGYDALAKHLGIELVEVKPGYAVATMVSKPELLNAMGLTHGGTIFTLADVAFGAASNAQGPLALALDVHISYIKATKSGDILMAVAREENITAKTALYRMEVKSGTGEMVAMAQGRVLRRA
jgi:acyl-CoA thioesterase